MSSFDFEHSIICIEIYVVVILVIYVKYVFVYTHVVLCFTRVTNYLVYKCTRKSLGIAYYILYKYIYTFKCTLINITVTFVDGACVK